LQVVKGFSEVAVLALVAVAWTAPARAQAAEREFHRLHAAVLFGDTHAAESNGFTFGGDIEFRPVRLFGVGFTGEHVNEPFRENVWVFGFTVHPARGLRLTIGPGFERATHAEAGHHDQHALLRVGAAYEIPLRHGWTVDPDVALDFVARERITVYSVAIGKEFGRAGH
jgi:hypothetical protein